MNKANDTLDEFRDGYEIEHKKDWKRVYDIRRVTRRFGNHAHYYQSRDGVLHATQLAFRACYKGFIKGLRKLRER